MRECVLFAPMIGARPGELTAGESKALEAHLSLCSACRGVAQSSAAIDGLVGEALLARANARDFAPFLDGVLARVEGAPRRSAGVLSWIHRHRRAAVAALAPALAALAVLVYVRLGSGGGEVAMLEVSSEGEATTILQTNDGPVVLLAEENET
jgi:anti-sigma factor ChrR (cupin superfamily)